MSPSTYVILETNHSKWSTALVLTIKLITTEQVS